MLNADAVVAWTLPIQPPHPQGWSSLINKTHSSKDHRESGKDHSGDRNILSCRCLCRDSEPASSWLHCLANMFNSTKDTILCKQGGSWFIFYGKKSNWCVERKDNEMQWMATCQWGQKARFVGKVFLDKLQVDWKERTLWDKGHWPGNCVFITNCTSQKHVVFGAFHPKCWPGMTSCKLWNATHVKLILSDTLTAVLPTFTAWHHLSGSSHLQISRLRMQNFRCRSKKQSDKSYIYII